VTYLHYATFTLCSWQQLIAISSNGKSRYHDRPCENLARPNTS